MIRPWQGGSLRGSLTALLSDGNTVANYQLAIGLTGTTNASAWANQIGAAGPLLQATGAAQPAIQADSSLLFDGVAQFMKATFTLNQPMTGYVVVKPISWIDQARIIGSGVGTVLLYQASITPRIFLYSGGAPAAQNSDLVIGQYGVVTFIHNGASSSIQVNSSAATTGNPGSANLGGITVAAESGGSNFGNIQVKEIIVRSGSDSAGTQARIQALLKQIYGTP